MSPEGRQTNTLLYNQSATVCLTNALLFLVNFDHSCIGGIILNSRTCFTSGYIYVILFSPGCLGFAVMLSLTDCGVCFFSKPNTELQSAQLRYNDSPSLQMLNLGNSSASREGAPCHTFPCEVLGKGLRAGCVPGSAPPLSFTLNPLARTFPGLEPFRRSHSQRTLPIHTGRGALVPTKPDTAQPSPDGKVMPDISEYLNVGGIRKNLVPSHGRLSVLELLLIRAAKCGDRMGSIGQRAGPGAAGGRTA